MKIVGPIPEHILSKMNPEDRAPMGKAGLTQAELDVRTNARNEKELQAQVENLLRLRDIFFVRSRMDRPTTTRRGTADFVLAYRSVPVALECKVGANVQTEEQKRVEFQMRANGWFYIIVRHIDDVIAVLKMFDAEAPKTNAPPNQKPAVENRTVDLPSGNAASVPG